MAKRSIRSIAAQLRAALPGVVAQVRRDAKAAAEKVAKPEKLQGLADGATRTGQVMAALLLGPVIVVNLVIITVFGDVMTGVFGGISLDSTQTGIFAFLITAILLGTLVLSAWAWFQWVRTSGFGAFQ